MIVTLMVVCPALLSLGGAAEAIWPAALVVV
jgi:hypothetical protein